MILKKIGRLFLILALGLGLTLTTLMPNYAAAQYSNPNLCPIDGYLSIKFENLGITTVVENEFFDTLEITNDSSFVMAGFRIGIGVYDSLEDTTPDFWTVLPDQIQVQPKSQVSVPVTLDMSALPAGKYFIKTFTNQGDETSVLGAAVRDVDNTPSVPFTKTSEQLTFIEMTTYINDYKAEGRLLEVGKNFKFEVKTKNNGLLPVTNTKLIISVSEDEVVLGGAVLRIFKDNIKIIPKMSQNSIFETRSVGAGEQVVYTALISDYKLKPLKKSSFVVGEREGAKTWPYISVVGINNSSLKEASEIITCVDYVGDYSGVLSLSGVVGIETNVFDKEGEGLYENWISSLDQGQEMFFISSPGISPQAGWLEISLLEPGPFGSSDSVPAGFELSGADTFQAIQTLNILFECPEESGCLIQEKQTKYTSSYLEDVTKESFFFYAAVTISALLLMYIILRRLPTKKINSDRSESV